MARDWIGMADGSLPKDKPWSTNNSFSPGMPPNAYSFDLSKEQAEEEDALLQFNRNFQASILKHFDEQLHKLYDEIDRRDHELGLSQKAREDLALALCDVKRQIPDLRKTIEKTQKELSSIQCSKKDLEYHAIQTDSELSDLRKLNSVNAAEIQRLKGNLEKEIGENTKLRELQNVVAEDLKMHHVYEQSLKAEIAHLVEDKRQIQRALHQWQNRFEKAMASVRDISCEANAQKDQTKLAQATVAATAKEMELLSKSNDLLIARWEQSVDAMDERDQVLKRNAADIAQTRKQLKTLEILATRAESDNGELMGKHATLQQQYFRALESNDALKADLNESRRTEAQTQKALENTGLAYHQVLAGLTEAERRESALKEKIDKVQEQLAEEKAVVVMMKGQIRELKDKEENMSKILGQRLADTEAEIANETAANQRLSIAIQSAQAQSEQVIATLQVEITRLQEQNRQFEIATQMAQQRWEKAERHTSHLQADLSMMESRAFRAEQKAAELAEAPAEAEKKWGGQVTEMRTTLEMTKNELSVMRTAYIDLQKKIVKGDRRNEAIDAQRKFSDAFASVTTFKSKRLEAELRTREQTEKELIFDLDQSRAQSKAQASKLYSEQMQKLAQEKALVEAEFRNQAVVTECQSSIDQYKLELAKVRADRARQGQELAKAIQDRTRAETAVKTLQLQLATARDQLDQQLRLAHDLQNQITALKRDRLTNDKRFQGWALQFQEVQRKRHDKLLPSVTKKRSTREPTGANALEQLKAESQVLRQIRTDLNRAHVEVQTKALEVARLQQQTEMLSNKQAESRDLCNQLEAQVEVSKQQNSTLEKNLFKIGQRCVRAESMAAIFETQLKELKPDLVIDYTFQIQKPSTKLFEVICSGDDDDEQIDNQNTDLLLMKDMDRFLKEMEFT